MICEDARAFLQDYADGALSEAARATVERHLAECDGCAADLKALGHVDEKLRAQPVLPTPPGLVDRIMVRVFPTSKPSFGREILRFAAAAAILAAVTAGTLSLNLRSLVGETTSQLVQQGITPIEGAVDQIDGWYRGLTEE
ncbi:MAG: anti-sigma factor family protein [Planctomycetota bacterium]|jgi:anti-sigma factor RsiW